MQYINKRQVIHAILDWIKNIEISPWLNVLMLRNIQVYKINTYLQTWIFFNSVRHYYFHIYSILRIPKFETHLISFKKIITLKTKSYNGNVSSSNKFNEFSFILFYFI